MILSFSGTGNSDYVARKLAERIGDDLLSLNDRIKKHDVSPILAQRLVIVTPTYAWRMPRLVTDYLLSIEITKFIPAWFVLTCGDSTGNAYAYAKKFCEKKEIGFNGLTQVVMPENYIALYDAPSIPKAKKIIQNSDDRIIRIARDIANGERFPKEKTGGHFLSSVVNPIFYRFIVKDKAFASGPVCNGCGLCERLCPENDIVISGGKPQWNGHCTHCMACICHCPRQAIEYGKKSVGKMRYVCPS
jgi:ferredoxin